MMPRTTFQVRMYFIRHAESESNALGTHIGGHNISCPLSSLGNDQAILLGKRLKHEKIQFDYMLCSTAARTQRTAELVLRLINADLSKLNCSSALLEQSQGDWQGMERAMIYTPEVRQQMDDLHLDFCPPNGESKRMVQERVFAFLQPIIEQAKNESRRENREISIVVFTHANSIRSILQYYLKSDPVNLWLIEQHNTSINEIIHSEHGVSIVRLNDVSHLTLPMP